MYLDAGTNAKPCPLVSIFFSHATLRFFNQLDVQNFSFFRALVICLFSSFEKSVGLSRLLKPRILNLWLFMCGKKSEKKLSAFMYFQMLTVYEPPRHPKQNFR